MPIEVYYVAAAVAALQLGIVFWPRRGGNRLMPKTTSVIITEAANANGEVSWVVQSSFSGGWTPGVVFVEVDVPIDTTED